MLSTFRQKEQCYCCSAAYSHLLHVKVLLLPLAAKENCNHHTAGPALESSGEGGAVEPGQTSFANSPSTTLTGLPSVQFVPNDVREMSNTADMKKSTLVTPLEVNRGCRYSTLQRSAPECHPQTPLPPCAACCHWCFWWFRPAQPVTSLQVSSHLKVLLSFHKNFSFSENSGHFS